MLTIAQVAELLGTPERFVRRLVAERRIGFTKVGRYCLVGAFATPWTSQDSFVDQGVRPLRQVGRRVLP